MKDHNIIIEQPSSTVVAEFTPLKTRQVEYQTEEQLETDFIKQLITQGYELLDITNNNQLLTNLKIQIEKLNSLKFTDNEWKTFCEKYLLNSKDGIVEKTKKVQEDYIFNMKLDNGVSTNIRIIDKDNIHNNVLQVIHQYEVTGTYKNRYDVTILVNGLPLVHIELKRRGVPIREAFNQIKRYSNESFWADSGLYEYAHIYVISNGTHTKYYSNTTRELANKENRSSNNNTKKTSNSFEFTSNWADSNNKIIEDVFDFAATFLSKHALLNILVKYCVFTADDMLLVMRPYQIVATEKIVNKIAISHNYKKYGKIDAGGYIWHTTGSGKTLTSFKTARLLKDMPHIKKVLFVVDRKDLDYQTMKEYDKFEKGAANSNTSTKVLEKQLKLDNDSKIIITTIQKLSIFIGKNKGHEIFNEEVVIIFDECHRSQFGDMHKAITKAFKKYYIYGFTGTPIFASNTSIGNKFPTMKTTEQVFGEQLHTYTIVDAINDGNVLKFRIDYINTAKEKDSIKDEDVYDIQREATLLSKGRISEIVKYILDHFDQKTKRNTKSYEFNKLLNINEVSLNPKRKIEVKEVKQNIRMTGFNSIFATASIEAAKRYYAEFKKQQEQLPPNLRIKVALIYSWSPNEELDGLAEENSENTTGLDASSREFLDSAIDDYNNYFNTNYDTSSDKFENYYKDLSLRVKNREVDLLIVVNMFLTGFDATTLNTLWVDKKLRQHGLIQAFSRTNRILNSIKTYGNIVCFRNLEPQVKDAISIFGDKDTGGIVLLKSFKEYYNGYPGFVGYRKLIEDITLNYPLGQPIIGEKKEKEFIKRFNEILKTKNILQSFDDFAGNEILSAYDYQDYQSIYMDLYDKYRKTTTIEAENIEDDIIFEIELVKSVEINVDYILMLVGKYHDSNCQDKEIEVAISKAIDSSPSLRNKKDLIISFVKSITVDSSVDDDWTTFIETKKYEELDKIINEENLKKEETYKFIKESFARGEVKDKGTDIVSVLPKTKLFDNSSDSSRSIKKQTVTEKFKTFFERFFGL